MGALSTLCFIQRQKFLNFSGIFRNQAQADPQHKNWVVQREVQVPSPHAVGLWGPTFLLGPNTTEVWVLHDRETV